MKKKKVDLQSHRFTTRWTAQEGRDIGKEARKRKISKAEVVRQWAIEKLYQQI